jgi:carbonic anhydrase
MLAHLLENNRRWAHQVTARDPGFFRSLVAQQSPRYLWIGCSDSRVPANEIVGLAPGELFVHRNVANVVVHTDLNCLSVLQFAVDVLMVEHVIVCGHYGCGGVRAAYLKSSLGLIDNWLRHVRDVHDRHQSLIERGDGEDAAIDRLCERNVMDQVRHVCQTTIVQDAWRRKQPVAIHGWIYDLRDGLLRDLQCTASSPQEEDGHTPAISPVLSPNES